MLSRIADSLFWLNRYMERSDCQLRVIRTNYILSFDLGNGSSFSWNDVLRNFSSCANGESNSVDTIAALKMMITEIKNINSVKVLITKARENARGVQDNITKEVWEQVNHMYHLVNQKDLEKKLAGSRSLEMIDLFVQNSTQYNGVTDNTMPRGQGWNFMNIGKFIERCLLTIEIANAHFSKIDYRTDQPQDILFWKNLLYSLSGYELYLKNYTRDQHNENVIDHIIFNRNFPRSLIYSLSRLNRYLSEVVEDTRIEGSDQLGKTLGRISSNVEFADMNMIQQRGLQQFIYDIRNDLIQFSNQLTRIYFSYA